MRVSLANADGMVCCWNQYTSNYPGKIQEFGIALKVVKDWLTCSYEMHMGRLVMWHWEKPVAIIEYLNEEHPDSLPGYVVIRRIDHMIQGDYGIVGVVDLSEREEAVSGT